MKDTLRGGDSAQIGSGGSCLNPCFNGRYSLSNLFFTYGSKSGGLNPCFNGRYSLRVYAKNYVILYIVLILVLMEDTL